MSLADLIRGKRSVAVATAIPAIPATHGPEWAGTVARIATVAVANPTEAKSGDGNSSKNSNCSSSKPRQQQTASYRWILHFADQDPLTVAFSPPASHAEVLECYPDALAAEPGRVLAGDDDMRTCLECGNLRGGVCVVARPGGLVSAVRGYRPSLVDVPIRCAGYSPNASDTEQRPGRERWPGLANDTRGAK